MPNPYIPGSDTIIGPNEPGLATENLLSESEVTFKDASAAYAAPAGDGVVEGPGSSAIPVKAGESLFNPFYMFRYAKFGSTDGKEYSTEMHRDIHEISKTYILGPTADGPDALASESKYMVENPSATELIRWAADSASENLNGTTIGPTPYQLNDFLWCKWYGKIPNNRLLTLRRYPIPVEDNLQIAKEKMPLIPTAQAVTWWGGETGNSIGEILGINYGFNWEPISSEFQDITGNEIGAGKLLDAIGISQAEDNPVRKILLATMFDNADNAFEATGYDATLQKWVKDAWGDQGQYWNRVLGPVNVIDSTMMRKRGFKYEHPIQLKFTYKLRSFGNVNPKVAMLDLISNFLSLTHNTAEFWGGAIRYFQKTGYILPGMPTTLFEEGDFIGGIEDVVKYMAALIKEQLDDIKQTVDSVGKGVNAKDVDGLIGTAKKSSALQNIAGSWVKNLMQIPLTMRTFLDGRAVGEWHLTVGNPMSPFATIGNLIVKNTTIKFSDEMGLDDTPTEVEFTVNLEHGRPRAKQDIESMFNLGAGKMYFSPLPPPSSASNTFGEGNSNAANNVSGNTDDIPNTTSNNPTGLSSAGIAQTGANDDINPGEPRNLEEATKLADGWRPRVSRAYGTKFGQSPILIDYFKDLKTKD